MHALCAVQNLEANRAAVSELGSSPMGPCGALPAAVQMRASQRCASSPSAKAWTAISSLASSTRVVSWTVGTARRISSADESSLSCDRLAISTLPPRDAMATAAALPIPEEPPTTMAESGLAAQWHVQSAESTSASRMLTICRERAECEERRQHGAWCEN